MEWCFQLNKLMQVAPDDVAYIWPTLEPFLQRPFDKFHLEIYFDLSDFKMCCMIEDMQLWIIVTEEGLPVGAIVSELLKYPKGVAAKLLLTGSDDSVKNWEDIMNTI